MLVLVLQVLLAASGQAQMWVRVGDERGVAGDVEGQEQAYRKALETDPRLARDPAFRVRFEKVYLNRKLKTAQQQPQQQQPPDQVQVQPVPPKPNPGVRSHRFLGATLSFGPEDILAVSATVFLWQHLQFTASFGAVTPSFTADARWVWFKSQISPFISAGVHLPFGRGFVPAPWADIWRATYFYMTAGAQLVSSFGLYVHAGVSFVPSLDSTPGRLDWPRLMPAVSAGWLVDL